MKVLLAGAGIGGLTAALALLRRGVEVRIFEQAEALREVGAGVQVSANGMRVLRDLGVAEAVVSLGVSPARREVRLWNTARAWTSFDLGSASLGRYGEPYVTLYRPDLLGVLERAVRALDPAAIMLGTRAEGFAQDRTGVALRLADGRLERGDALVGADGIHSVLREALHGPTEAAFTGCVAWRGVVPAAALPPHQSVYALLTKRYRCSRSTYEMSTGIASVTRRSCSALSTRASWSARRSVMAAAWSATSPMASISLSAKHGRVRMANATVPTRRPWAMRGKPA